MSYVAKKEPLVGPMNIVAHGGWHRVIDRGNGSVMLANKFKSRSAAVQWCTRIGMKVVR